MYKKKCNKKNYPLGFAILDIYMVLDHKSPVHTVLESNIGFQVQDKGIFFFMGQNGGSVVASRGRVPLVVV